MLDNYVQPLPNISSSYAIVIRLDVIGTPGVGNLYETRASLIFCVARGKKKIYIIPESFFDVVLITFISLSIIIFLSTNFNLLTFF